jgi:hypothetical protein
MSQRGMLDFVIQYIELSPHQVQRAREIVVTANLSEDFDFVVADFNTWTAEGTTYLELEHLFGAVRTSLHPDGVSASVGMIGRNGHMRWPCGQGNYNPNLGIFTKFQEISCLY